MNTLKMPYLLQDCTAENDIGNGRVFEHVQLMQKAVCVRHEQNVGLERLPTGSSSALRAVCRSVYMGIGASMIGKEIREATCE